MSRFQEQWGFIEGLKWRVTRSDCILKGPLWLWLGEQIGGEPEGMWGALLGGSAGPQALQAQWHGCAAGRPVGCGVQPVVCGPWLGREILLSLSSPDSAGAPCVDLAGVRFQRTELRYTAPPPSLPPAPCPQRPVSATVRAACLFFWRSGGKGFGVWPEPPHCHGGFGAL